MPSVLSKWKLSVSSITLWIEAQLLRLPGNILRHKMPRFLDVQTNSLDNAQKDLCIFISFFSHLPCFMSWDVAELVREAIAHTCPDYNHKHLWTNVVTSERASLNYCGPYRGVCPALSQWLWLYPETLHHVSCFQDCRILALGFAFLFSTLAHPILDVQQQYPGFPWQHYILPLRVNVLLSFQPWTLYAGLGPCECYASGFGGLHGHDLGTFVCHDPSQGAQPRISCNIFEHHIVDSHPGDCFVPGKPETSGLQDCRSGADLSGFLSHAVSFGILVSVQTATQQEVLE